MRKTNLYFDRDNWGSICVFQCLLLDVLIPNVSYFWGWSSFDPTPHLHILRVFDPPFPHSLNPIFQSAVQLQPLSVFPSLFHLPMPILLVTFWFNLLLCFSAPLLLPFSLTFLTVLIRIYPVSYAFHEVKQSGSLAAIREWLIKTGGRSDLRVAECRRGRRIAVEACASIEDSYESLLCSKS